MRARRAAICSLPYARERVVRGLAVIVVSSAALAAAGCAQTGSMVDGATAADAFSDAHSVDGRDPRDGAQLIGAFHVAAGDQHTCASTPAGTVACWGDDSYGQSFSRVTRDAVAYVTDESFRVLDGFTQVAANRSHTCARRSDGTAWCWGNNDEQQIGDASLGSALLPTLVAGLTGVVGIAAGFAYTCGWSEDGSARCWGANQYGQLGVGARGLSRPPAVLGLPPVRTIATGPWSACAVLRDATLRCWGLNGAGELGDGTTAVRTTPVSVAGLSDVSGVCLSYQHTCAWQFDGTAWCWGREFRRPFDSPPRLVPTRVEGLANVVGMACAYYHACAVLRDGTVRCWGANWSGQLGIGSLSDVGSEPIEVPSLSGVTSIAAGAFHTCVVRADEGVWCWGRNDHFQVAPDPATYDDQHPSPVRVTGL